MNDQNENQIIEMLTREGVLINVSVRYWRATKKLTAEDLGLPPERVTDRLIRLGHKKLLPDEQLKPFALIEGRAHSLIKSGTFPFLGSLGHFLPNAKLEEVTGGLEVQRRAFDEAKNSFLGQYSEIRDSACEEWREAAARLVADPERLVEVIRESFPHPSRMEESFAFDVQLFQIRVPEGLDMELADWQEQRSLILAREKAAAEAKEQIRTGAERFVADCVGSLREQTATLCEEILESMRTCKKGVHQRTLNRLVRFIGEFKELNFVGDHEMEQQLDRVREEFLGNTAEEYRNDAVARARLKDGLQGLAGFARELMQQDSREVVESFGQMGRRKIRLSA